MSHVQMLFGKKAIGICLCSDCCECELIAAFPIQTRTTIIACIFTYSIELTPTACLIEQNLSKLIDRRTKLYRPFREVVSLRNLNIVWLVVWDLNKALIIGEWLVCGGVLLQRLYCIWNPSLAHFRDYC